MGLYALVFAQNYDQSGRFLDVPLVIIPSGVRSVHGQGIDVLAPFQANWHSAASTQRITGDWILCAQRYNSNSLKTFNVDSCVGFLLYSWRWVSQRYGKKARQKGGHTQLNAGNAFIHTCQQEADPSPPKAKVHHYHLPCACLKWCHATMWTPRLQHGFPQNTVAP